MRKKVFSVLREMHWWYDHSGKPTRLEGEMKATNTAESLKHWLLRYMPDNAESLADEDATASSRGTDWSLSNCECKGSAVSSW